MKGYVHKSITHLPSLQYLYLFFIEKNRKANWQIISSPPIPLISAPGRLVDIMLGILLSKSILIISYHIISYHVVAYGAILWMEWNGMEWIDKWIVGWEWIIDCDFIGPVARLIASISCLRGWWILMLITVSPACLLSLGSMLFSLKWGVPWLQRM